MHIGRKPDPATSPWNPPHETIYSAGGLWNIGDMKIESLHVGMPVRHPQYGLGTVKTIGEHSADIQFNDGLKTVEPVMSDLQPAEAQVAVTGLTVPLAQFVAQTAEAIVRELGFERPDQFIDQLAARWHNGRLALHAADAGLQPKEVPLEVFFHKIVMIRNNLRVLEQKINGHDKLTDADKVELQQYITRSYGSLTTFNLLFKNKADQFGGTAAG